MAAPSTYLSIQPCFRSPSTFWNGAGTRKGGRLGWKTYMAYDIQHRPVEIAESKSPLTLLRFCQNLPWDLMIYFTMWSIDQHPKSINAVHLPDTNNTASSSTLIWHLTEDWRPSEPLVLDEQPSVPRTWFIFCKSWDQGSRLSFCGTPKR